MALTPEDIKFIRQLMDQRLNLILPGVSQNATGRREDVANRYPGLPVITDRPVMSPWGFVSRAPAGTPQVTARMGAHPANVMVLGHMDLQPPAIGAGETAFYSTGVVFKLLKDKLQLIQQQSGFSVEATSSAVTAGKNDTQETLVAGETLVELLGLVIDWMVAHTHITTAPGASTTAAPTASDLTALKAQYLTTPKILIKSGGRF